MVATSASGVKSVDRVEWELGVEELIGGEAGGNDQDLGAVGRALGNPVESDVAAGAGDVLDHHRGAAQWADSRSARMRPTLSCEPPAGKPTTSLMVWPLG